MFVFVSSQPHSAYSFDLTGNRTCQDSRHGKYIPPLDGQLQTSLPRGLDAGWLTAVVSFALHPGAASVSFWFSKAVRNALVNKMTPATFGWDPGCDSPHFPSAVYGGQGHQGGLYQPETRSDYDIQILYLPHTHVSLTYTHAVCVLLETINEKRFFSGQKKGICLWWMHKISSYVNISTCTARPVNHLAKRPCLGKADLTNTMLMTCKE